VDLAEACTTWQSGRNGGSSLLRGAARVLTGIPHYFDETWITDYESLARKSQAALGGARILMDAVSASRLRAAADWGAECALPGPWFAGRGLKSGPQDAQILASFAKREVQMPLWGFSLDSHVALGYGKRFVLELDGPFHGIAAWQASGLKEDEREIIASGVYTVVTQDERDGTTHVVLREREQLWLMPA
jgi:hypothetical protein